MARPSTVCESFGRPNLDVDGTLSQSAARPRRSCIFMTSVGLASSGAVQDTNRNAPGIYAGS